MRFNFWGRKAKPKRKYKRRKKSVSRSQCGKMSQISHEHETELSQSLETSDTSQVLARLDVMMGFLREHHGIIKNQIQEAHCDLKEQLLTVAMAKKVIRETSLDKIVREKLSHGETKSHIVRQLIEMGACSRATAYRVLERNQMCQMSQISQALSQRK